MKKVFDTLNIFGKNIKILTFERSNPTVTIDFSKKRCLENEKNV